MKTITINNYEIYALDFLEGRLDEETHIAFEKFLSENPEIFDEIYDVKDIKLTKQVISYSNKTKLKKSPVAGLTYEEYLFVSAIEDTLTYEEKEELEHILQFEEKMQEYIFFRKTKLQKQVILYPHKSKLKKSGARQFFYYTAAVAASVVVFLISYFNFDNIQNDIQNPFVKNYALSRTKNVITKYNKSVSFPDQELISLSSERKTKEEVIPDFENFVPEEELTFIPVDNYQVVKNLEFYIDEHSFEFKDNNYSEFNIRDLSKDVINALYSRLNIPETRITIESKKDNFYGIKFRKRSIGIRF